MSSAHQNPFSGLPAPMVKDILARGGDISGGLAAPLDDICSKRTDIREALSGRGVIKTHDTAASTISVCAVDGCCDVSPQLLSDFHACAAFAVEGLGNGESTALYPEPKTEWLLHADSRIEDASDIAGAILDLMQVRLIAETPHSIVMIRAGLDTAFNTILKVLPLAMRHKKTKSGADFMSRLKPALAAFKKLAAESSVSIVTVKEHDSGSELLDGLDLVQGIDQSAAFTVLLEPGEYTTPVEIARDDVKRAAAVSIKDETFAGLRDTVVAWFETFRALYYRPREWTPAFRIELPGASAVDPDRLAQVLSALAGQCPTAGFTQPFPLYTAKQYSRHFFAALPILMRASVDDITDRHGDRIAALLPLLFSTLNTR